MQMNPEQKRTFWTIVLTILKMIFFIGQKHVEKHAAFDNRSAKTDRKAVIKADDASALPTNQQICGDPEEEEHGEKVSE